ncbi:GNAT family N-acetyltransferase [Brevundimonas lenta]|uniref:GNAT superfamily N-acetyltransferase n=1 Tax=Brevundimonas lenta TaxID=424796 RepID=A0A7W6JC80_9CAUL|nr:GNAT family N-acetyltransferase [Brevundimonas lenta]MBB4081507.1 GNAT superfamily N-acetyltransferase [Brevundimonas lenta]
MSVDPELLAIWIRGWAVTRGVQAPVRDDGAWRVDVGQPDQIARYVYADPGEALRSRATAIRVPHVFLKVCAGADVVRPFLDERWAVQPPGFMMTLAGTMGPPEDAPAGYRLELEPGPVSFARFLTGDGEEAACGRVAVVEERIIFDRILTAPEHGRRGLGSRLMRILETVGRERGGRDGVLVATEAGRALYERLGWELHAPYTTAVIPG